MIQDVITIALVCNEEVMLIHAYISALKGEVLRGDDKNFDRKKKNIPTAVASGCWLLQVMRSPLL